MSASDPSVVDAAAVYQPGIVEKWLPMIEKLDPHFADVWITYTGGLMGRSVLDTRTRLLVLTGQYSMRRDHDLLAETIRAAIAADVDLKEVLEVILQTWVYGGQSVMLPGVEVYATVVSEAGRMDEVGARGLPVGATTTDVDLELEDAKAMWTEEDRDDPRLGRLIERTDWLGLHSGFTMRPGLHFNTIAALDAIDADFGARWQNALYRDVYARGVLDERTRLLCIVGNCLSVGETYQSPRHMRSALRHGAKPSELFEVIFQSCAIVGHPHLMGLAVDDLVMVLEDLGRLGEMVAEEDIEGLLRITHTRVARRHGVAETTAADTRG